MMQSTQNDQHTAEKNALFALHALTMLGDREEQQDSYGYHLKKREGLVVLCDGMGGHQGGAKASSLTVRQFLQDYKAWNREAEEEYSPANLRASALKANEAVCNLKNEEVRSLRAGTTLVSVFIRERKMFWCSTGDTRAYLMRGKELAQLTVDHNYGTVLEEKRAAGLMNEEEMSRSKKREEALVSYLGIGETPLFDENKESLFLQEGDILCLCTDGLYRMLSNEVIKKILVAFPNMGEALKAMEIEVARSAQLNGIKRDNMSVILIKVLEQKNEYCSMQ